MQDQEIIRRIRQGEKQLFGPLVEKYYDDVFRYCWYCTGSKQAASDCTQETFYHLMRFLDSYTEHGRFKPYLLRIALNSCRDYFRKTKLTELPLEDLTKAPGAADGQAVRSFHAAASPEKQVLDNLQIQSGLMRLSETHRETVILYFYYGYKQREIARITGVPLSTVKTRLRAAIGQLRDIFAQEGESL